MATGFVLGLLSYYVMFIFLCFINAVWIKGTHTLNSAHVVMWIFIFGIIGSIIGLMLNLNWGIVT